MINSFGQGEKSPVEECHQPAESQPFGSELVSDGLENQRMLVCPRAERVLIIDTHLRHCRPGEANADCSPALDTVTSSQSVDLETSWSTELSALSLKP